MRYEIMREERLDPDLGAMRPAILWVWDPDGKKGQGQATLLDVGGYAAAIADYSAKAEDAARRSFTNRDIWEYFGRKEGDGYFSRRTSPIAVEYADVDELVRVELAIMRGEARAKVPAKKAGDDLAALFEEILTDLTASEEMVADERSTDRVRSAAELEEKLREYRRRFTEIREGKE